MKIPELNCTITLENAHIEDFIESNDMMGNTVCRVKIIGTLVPRTCEHCKFWDRYKDYDPRQCLNEKVINLVDGGPEEEPYYHKDFGCIFWESKE
jgi:hypothetical protein